MSRTYEHLIPKNERDVLEKALGMETGYVLDFTDADFNDFIYETIKIDPKTETHFFNGRGTSKAKRLRSFIERAEPRLVALLLRELWEYLASGKTSTYWDAPVNKKIHDSYFQTVSRFEGADQTIDSSAFEAFEPSETLEELIASLKRDLDAKSPQAALDRLHTYCMKRFASLVRKHGGQEFTENDALHSRVGRYVKIMKAQRNLTEMSERIIKSSISIFEALNPIRNDKSLAHDNPDLVHVDEARFIFESVAALLRYIKSVDTRLFED